MSPLSSPIQIFYNTGAGFSSFMCSIELITLAEIKELCMGGSMDKSVHMYVQYCLGVKGDLQIG